MNDKLAAGKARTHLHADDHDRLIENALQLADAHRKECIGAECTISLHSLYRLLVLGGFELKQEHFARFM